MSELPKNWTESELGNLFSFVIGGDWGKSPDYVDEDYVDVLCIRGTEFRNWKDDKGSTASHRRIKSASLEKRSLNLGDILIEISGGGPDQPVGRTVLIDADVLGYKSDIPKVGTNFLRLARPTSLIFPAYLNYYLLNFYKSGVVTKYQGGSNNLRNLKFKDYIEILIPIAPLNEQVCISNKLGSLINEVESTQKKLDKIPTLLKRFRQSVLAAAVSGKLVEISEIKRIKLGDISVVKTGNTPLKSNLSYYENATVPWLTSTVTGQKLVTKANKFISELAVKECRLKVFPKGTLLLAMYGEGKTRGQVTEIAIEATINQACAAITVNEDIASKSFVKICIENNYEQTRLMAEGGAQPNLNLTKVRSIPVILPSIKEQKQIVQQVESLFNLVEKVEQQYLAAKQRTDKLTQSILAKAFQGKLVPQDPNDEPASELLKRIQLLRAVGRSKVKSKYKE